MEFVDELLTQAKFKPAQKEEFLVLLNKYAAVWIIINLF